MLSLPFNLQLVMKLALAPVISLPYNEGENSVMIAKNITIVT